MMLKLYQVLDKQAACVVGPIISVRHMAQAIRLFNDTLATEGTTLNQHPDDYDLMYVGEQDDETGALAPSQTQIVHTGTAWKASQA